MIVHGRSGGRAEAVAEAIRAAGGTAEVALGDLADDTGAAAVAEAVLAEAVLDLRTGAAMQ